MAKYSAASSMYISVAALPVCAQLLLKVLCSQMICLKSVEMWSRTGTAACLADVTLLISGFVDLEKANLHLMVFILSL